MYAITATGYRAINSPADAQAGETVVDVLPASLLSAIASQEAAERAKDGAIREQALTALTNLRAYRDAVSPTSAQTIAVVRLLCRVSIGLIRLQLRRLDASD